MGGKLPKILKCPSCDEKVLISFAPKIKCPNCGTVFFYWEAKEFFIKTHFDRISRKEVGGTFKIRLKFLKKKYCPTV